MSPFVTFRHYSAGIFYPGSPSRRTVRSVPAWRMHTAAVVTTSARRISHVSFGLLAMVIAPAVRATVPDAAEKVAILGTTAAKLLNIAG